MTARMLGRRPPKNTPALRLAAFLTGQVPAHPVAADHFSQVNTWFLGANSSFGTCGPTSVANYLKLVYRYLLGEDITITDGAIFDLYRRSGNPGFDPVTGADDNGVDLQTMLEALAAGGIQVVRANGTVETVKPVAFAKVNPSDLDEIRAAVSIFGGGIFGVDLEVAQQAQTDMRPPLWDYRPSGRWGGHAVCGGRYTSDPSRADVSVVSWAEVVGTTDAFLRSQLGEVWALIFPAHLSHPAFQQGVDLAAFAAAYLAVTSRPLPLPAPSVDDADRALAGAVRQWAGQRHCGATRTAAKAVETWLARKGL